MTLRGVLVVLATMALAAGAAASPAMAANRVKKVCGAADLANDAVGKTCMAATNVAGAVNARKDLIGSQLGGAANPLLNTGVSAVATSAIAIGIGAWTLGGAKYALRETAVVLGDTSSPQLRSTWFSSTYWRVAGIAVLLTLPFLFAAAVHALLRSDLALLLRAAFGYLPLAMLAVSIAAPVTMLLLAASDQLSAIVSSATGNASDRFVSFSVGALGELTVAAGPFMAFFLCLFVVAGAVVLWIELLMREAAVYVIVLMLPLAFAGMVWPARRVWAIRAVELLVALVMSKFAIVAVLSLGGAALVSGSSAASHSVTAALAGAVLLIMGAFTPWALLRLLPLAEVAASAAGSLSRETRNRAHSDLASLVAHSAPDWAADMTARLRDDASAATPLPPAAREQLDDATPATPQGGDGVAGRLAEEAPREAEEATQAEAAPVSEGEPASETDAHYETHDVGIDEMWKPENRGRWAP
ncbi:MAG TPA: hypothetical protein VFI54_25760 [Solirubrobacteraceae bacterium]|nr:hypothetical protein [Solirubrobacteraceae bacterium]